MFSFFGAKMEGWPKLTSMVRVEVMDINIVPFLDF